MRIKLEVTLGSEEEKDALLKLINEAEENGEIEDIQVRVVES